MCSIYIYIILYKFLDGESVEVNLLFFWLFDSSWKWPGSGLSLVEFTKPRISPQPSGHRILVICPMIRPPKANGYGSIPINTIFRGMNIHLQAILMFTRGTRFWHTAKCVRKAGPKKKPWTGPYWVQGKSKRTMSWPRRKDGRSSGSLWVFRNGGFPKWRYPIKRWFIIGNPWKSYENGWFGGTYTLGKLQIL